MFRTAANKLRGRFKPTESDRRWFLTQLGAIYNCIVKAKIHPACVTGLTSFITYDD